VDMLSSEELVVANEDCLFDDLVTFASTFPESDEAAGKLEELLPTLRIQHVSFAKLLDAAKGSKPLQRSHAFKTILYNQLRNGLQASRATDRDNATQSAETRRGTAPTAAAAAITFDTLVDWLLRPSAELAGVQTLLNQSLEAQEQQQRELALARRELQAAREEAQRMRRRAQASTPEADQDQLISVARPRSASGSSQRHTAELCAVEPCIGGSTAGNSSQGRSTSTCRLAATHSRSKLSGAGFQRLPSVGTWLLLTQRFQPAH